MEVRFWLPTVVVFLAGFATVGCSHAPETYASSCSTLPTHLGREKDGVGHLRVVQPIYIGSDGLTLWNKAIYPTPLFSVTWQN
jgi:hypothetical protein